MTGVSNVLAECVCAAVRCGAIFAPASQAATKGLYPSYDEGRTVDCSCKATPAKSLQQFVLIRVSGGRVVIATLHLRPAIVLHPHPSLSTRRPEQPLHREIIRLNYFS